MAWKLRKDRLQAKTPQDEGDGTEPQDTVSVPTPESIVRPEESGLSPSFEVAPFLSPPFLPVEDESAHVQPVAQAAAPPVESAAPAAPSAGFGLKWRSRKSQEDVAAPDAEQADLPATEVSPPSPPLASPFPYAFPETETAADPPASTAAPEPDFAPVDFGNPFSQPDLLSETQSAMESEPVLLPVAEPSPDHPFILTEPEPEVVAAQVEEPQPAPFDFATPVPQDESLLPVEERKEEYPTGQAESEEEPLFSPMPTPIWNPYLPPPVEAQTVDVGEPFFPLPPQGDNPFLDLTLDQPQNGAGEGVVEEPHFLSTDPHFTPMADWNPFLAPEPEIDSPPAESDMEAKAAHLVSLSFIEIDALVEPEVNHPEPEMAHEPGLPEPSDAFDTPRPAFLPSVFATPAVEALSAEPVAEPVAEAEPVFGTDFSELSPFAPFQPQAALAAEIASGEDVSTPPELDEPHVTPMPFESASTAPAPTYDAPPAFVSLTDYAPLPVVDPQPAYVSPFAAYGGQDAEREEIAPSLVMPETGTGVPRVAPFIVDVPSAEEAPTATGTLVLRMGKLSANYPVNKDAVVIGRPDSGVQSYPDLEIELDDAVSRRHAEVRRHDDRYFVVDTMSTNGTFLNGEKLDPYKEYLLAHGDRIRIGDRTELVFE